MDCDAGGVSLVESGGWLTKENTSVGLTAICILHGE